MREYTCYQASIKICCERADILMSANQITRAYSIKDVSKKINVPTGTIRQWEKDFTGLLHIPRSKQGARFYTDMEMALLKKIKEMRDKNISREMIRTLLEQHLNGVSQPASETFGGSEKPGETNEIIAAVPIAPASNAPAPEVLKMEEMLTVMENYRQDMIREIKGVIQNGKTEIVEDLQTVINQGNMHTIQGVAKSIQRSNDKRQAEIQFLNDAIEKASELTFETFGTISDCIAKASEDTYELLSQQITESSRSTMNESKNMLSKISRTVKEAQKDITSMSKTFQHEREHMVDVMNLNLQQFTEAVKEREEAFQDMVTGYREAAAAKKHKKWWNVWS